jgi:hypothetical protein
MASYLTKSVDWLKRNRRLVIIVLLMFPLMIYGRYILKHWERASGYEYEWVAQSLATGHGFSFDGRHRWLFINHDRNPDHKYPYDIADPDEYYATAWEEPVYVGFMALNFKLFGDYGRFVLMCFNLLFIYLTAWILFLIARQLWGPAAGIFAAVVMLAVPHSHLGTFNNIGNVWAVGFMAAACCLTLIWCLEQLSVRRAILLGVLIGFTTLIHAGTLLFTGLAALVILITPESLVTRLKIITAMALAVAVTVSPWTIRNYNTFGHLIPVRTGSGYVLYKGNPTLGAAIEPSLSAAHPQGVTPMWQAKNAYEALQKATSGKERRAMHVYSQQMVESSAPPDFLHYNEYERDHLYKVEAVKFIKQNPWVITKLILAKARFYLFNWGLLHTAITIFGIIGAIVFIRDKRCRAAIFLMAGLTVPYVLSQPIYYRYRYPAEPFFILLFTGTIFWIAVKLRSQLAKTASDTES